MKKHKLILEGDDFDQFDAILGDLPYKYAIPIIQLIQPHVKEIEPKKENDNDNDKQQAN